MEKMRQKKNKLYLGFMDLQQVYDRINMKDLWQVLLKYDAVGRLLNGIKSMYDDKEACVRINGIKSDWFNINSGVRQGCVMTHWLFNLYVDGVMKLSLIHISEPTRLLSISYAVFCLKKKKK